MKLNVIFTSHKLLVRLLYLHAFAIVKKQQIKKVDYLLQLSELFLFVVLAIILV